MTPTQTMHHALSFRGKSPHPQPFESSSLIPPQIYDYLVVEPTPLKKYELNMGIFPK